MDSLYDFYAHTCSRHGADRLFSTGMTYSETLELVHARASFLQKKGYGRGKVIAVLSHNSIEMCITFMAITSTGAKVLPLDPNLGSSNFAGMMKKAGAEAVYTTPEYSGYFRGLKVFPLELNEKPGNKTSFRKTAVKPDDIAALFFTSGTTGEPKIVQLSHGNIFRTALASAEFFRTGTDDMILCLLPLFHAYGLIAAFLGPMAHGSSLCIQPSLKGPDIMKSLEENPVTIFPAVPLLWELIMDGIIARVKTGPKMKYRIFMFCLKRGYMLRKTGLGFVPRAVFAPVRRAFGSRIRLLISGGAPLKTSCAHYYRSLGFTLVEGYGLSETTGPILISSDRKNIAGSVGVPVKGNEVKIADADKNGTGEILLRGNAVMPGYKSFKAGKDVFDSEGFFRTGDLGRFDKKGNLFITGRLKNVIVLSSGKNVYPEELENYYNQSDLIADIAVFGLNKNGVENVFAVIVPAEINQNSYRKILNEIKRLNHGLPSYKIISGFAVSHDPLPRNSTRKLLYDVIKECLGRGIYAEDEGAEAVSLAELTSGSPAEAMVIELLKKKTVRKKLFRGETPAQAGIDSLGLVDLWAHLEEKLEVTIDINGLKSIHTLDELVTCIASAEPSGHGSIEDRIFQGKITVKPYPLFSPLLWVTLEFMSLLFRFFWKLDTVGMEGTDLKGTIISPNHTSYLDIVLVACALPRRFRKKIYVQGTADFSFLRFVFPLIPVIWVDEHNTIDVLKKSSDMLRQGKSLIIFPEGGRSADGRMMDFRTGAAYLAKQLGRTITPVAINGAFDVWPKNKKFPRFDRSLRVDVTAGEAVVPGEYKDQESMTAEVKKRIRAMKKDINGTGWTS